MRYMEPVPVLISTYDRPNQLRSTLQTLFEFTETSIWVAVADDGSPGDRTREVLESFPIQKVLYLPHRGLVYSVNALFEAVKEVTTPSDFWVYAQDDLAFSQGWLWKMISIWGRWAEGMGFGLMAGVDDDAYRAFHEFAWEGLHVKAKAFAEGHLYLAPKDFWTRNIPVSIRNLDGSERGFPAAGRGSNVDWWFLRDSPQSLARTGQRVGVVSGLVQHNGDQSTWK